VIEVTDWARDILHRSHQAARRFDPGTAIRVVQTPAGVEARLADGPDQDDQALDLGGMTLYVEAGLAGVVDVEEPHDRLVLKPPGSPPNVRSEH
jgi:hypothetical protein